MQTELLRGLKTPAGNQREPRLACRPAELVKLVRIRKITGAVQKSFRQQFDRAAPPPRSSRRGPRRQVSDAAIEKPP